MLISLQTSTQNSSTPGSLSRASLPFPAGEPVSPWHLCAQATAFFVCFFTMRAQWLNTRLLVCLLCVHQIQILWLENVPGWVRLCPSDSERQGWKSRGGELNPFFSFQPAVHWKPGGGGGNGYTIFTRKKMKVAVARKPSATVSGGAVFQTPHPCVLPLGVLQLRRFYHLPVPPTTAQQFPLWEFMLHCLTYPALLEKIRNTIRRLKWRSK